MAIKNIVKKRSRRTFRFLKSAYAFMTSGSPAKVQKSDAHSKTRKSREPTPSRPNASFEDLDDIPLAIGETPVEFESPHDLSVQVDSGELARRLESITFESVSQEARLSLRANDTPLTPSLTPLSMPSPIMNPNGTEDRLMYADLPELLSDDLSTLDFQVIEGVQPTTPSMPTPRTRDETRNAAHLTPYYRSQSVPLRVVGGSSRGRSRLYPSESVQSSPNIFRLEHETPNY